MLIPNNIHSVSLSGLGRYSCHLSNWRPSTSRLVAIHRLVNRTAIKNQCDDHLLPLHLRPVRPTLLSSSRPRSQLMLIISQKLEPPNAGTATASTTTTGNTAPSVQSAPTKAARSSQASRTPSCPSRRQQPRRPPPPARPRPRPSPARATPSPRPRASSSRSATPASPQPRARHRCHRHRHRFKLLPPVLPRAWACLLMRRPSWCTASSSRCRIWSSACLAGASLISPYAPSPPLSFGFNSWGSRTDLTRAGTSRLSAIARRRTSCTSSKRSRATASSC